MRQIGLLTAACDYVLQNHFERLIDDHKNARKLADGLISMGFKVVYPHTNILMIDSSDIAVDLNVIQKILLEQYKIVIYVGSTYGSRLVTHLQITEKHVEYILNSISKIIKEMKK